MPDMEKIVTGLGIAALHLSSLAQKGDIYSALKEDADCCIEVIELLREQENASKRNPVIVCPHCGKRVK